MNIFTKNNCFLDLRNIRLAQIVDILTSTCGYILVVGNAKNTILKLATRFIK
jgi:hypothetical protein